MPKLYMGIDPGVNGGMAWIRGCESGLVAEAIKMPATEKELWEIIDHAALNTACCVLEEVHSMPKQGVKSTFTFGRHYGMVRGMLVAAGIPFFDAQPQVWQKAIGLRKKDKEEKQPAWKRFLMSKAEQAFPDLSMTLHTADAVLIAFYCFRTYQHEPV